MKNNMITAIFLALFLVSTTLNVWVILTYNGTLQKLRQLQTNVGAIGAVQQLYNESVEYGKTHPDMVHFLQNPLAGAPVSAPTNAKPNK